MPVDLPEKEKKISLIILFEIMERLKNIHTDYKKEERKSLFTL